MKTKIKLKELSGYKSVCSNKFTLYVYFSVHGRRDYCTAKKLAVEYLQRIFPAPPPAKFIRDLGWQDAKCRAIICAVDILLGDKIVYT